eukprot:9221636-Pyramimonas_sp.AAC.1
MDLNLVVPGRAQAWWRRHLRLPKPPPQVFPPREKPNPDSKRSYQKEGRARRMAALPEDLQDEVAASEPITTEGTKPVLGYHIDVA